MQRGSRARVADRRRVLVAGHLPPPVHGMAVATAAFVETLRSAADERNIEVVVRRTSAEPGDAGVVHHGRRLVRTIRAVAELVRRRRLTLALYVSVDADLGMLYTIGLCLAARGCAVPVYLHHHSSAYLGDAPSLRMRALCRCAGSYGRHVMACRCAAERLELLYGASDNSILSMLFAIELPSIVHTPPASVPHEGEPTSVGRPIRLGHLGNLSVEKGLVEVFETARLLGQLEVDVALVIAGPPATPTDSDRFGELMANFGGTVEYLGPLYGAAREAFFEQIDVFLFPSRYRHEYVGLVAWESLVRGVPVVAIRCTCLSEEAIGEAGLVIARDAAYAPAAANWIRDVIGDPSRRVEASDLARAVATDCQAARADAMAFAARMMDAGSAPSAPGAQTGRLPRSRAGK